MTQASTKPNLGTAISIIKKIGNTKAKKDMTRNYKDCCNYGKNPSERTLQDYFIPVIMVTDNIYYPPVETSSFKLKPTLISMMQNTGQFRGLPTKEPLAHLKKFLRFANTIRINNIPVDVLCLRLFPFSLANKAFEWLTTLPDGVITTWVERT
ncbi:hypothetical protein CR513_12588, partial [Mucuna pruriens]